MSINLGLIEAVTMQFEAECEETEEKKLPIKEKHMLRMKYGLSASQLTPSEKYLANKEENYG